MKFLAIGSHLHRRRIKTEEKAKVVISVWGKEFIKFLAALAILPWTILKNRIHPFLSNHPGAILLMQFKLSSAK